MRSRATGDGEGQGQHGVHQLGVVGVSVCYTTVARMYKKQSCGHVPAASQRMREHVVHSKCEDYFSTFLSGAVCILQPRTTRISDKVAHPRAGAGATIEPSQTHFDAEPCGLVRELLCPSPSSFTSSESPLHIMRRRCVGLFMRYRHWNLRTQIRGSRLGSLRLVLLTKFGIYPLLSPAMSMSSGSTRCSRMRCRCRRDLPAALACDVDVVEGASVAVVVLARKDGLTSERERPSSAEPT